MGKADFLSPKAISNRIKSKGLQKLRWYCQMCQKQCRDEVRPSFPLCTSACFVAFYSHICAVFLFRTGLNVTACPSLTRGSCCWPQKTPTGSWTISPSEFLYNPVNNHVKCQFVISAGLFVLFLSGSLKVDSWSCSGDVLVSVYKNEVKNLTTALLHCGDVIFILSRG